MSGTRVEDVMNNKAAQAYFQTKVSTTDQGQLLLLLYDGALNFLQQARVKMLEKDYAAKGILISKVIDIVSELANTLNLEKGGTLAENLNNLYFLCTTRLLQANLKMNVEQLDSVTSILSGLRSAYAQIINTPEAQKVAAQIATKINSAGSMTQRGAVVAGQTPAAPGALGQVQARMAYGQQAAQVTPMPVPAPVPAQAVASAPAQAVTQAPAAAPAQAAAPAAVAPHPVPAAPAKAPAVTSVAAPPSAPVTPTAAPAAASTATPPPPSVAVTPAPSAAPATPAAGLGLAQGFAAPQLGRKLASYSKMG